MAEPAGTQCVVILDPSQVPSAVSVAEAHGVAVDQVPQRCLEPLTMVTLVLAGSAAAVGTVLPVLDQRKGGQVIVWRAGRALSTATLSTSGRVPDAAVRASRLRVASDASAASAARGLVVRPLPDLDPLSPPRYAHRLSVAASGKEALEVCRALVTSAPATANACSARCGVGRSRWCDGWAT